MRAICLRSEREGFTRDVLGLDNEWEGERQRLIEYLADNKPAPNVIVPQSLINEPFPERTDARWWVDDGRIVASGTDG